MMNFEEAAKKIVDQYWRKQPSSEYVAPVDEMAEMVIEKALRSAYAQGLERAEAICDDYNDHACFTKSICGKKVCEALHAIRTEAEEE